MPFTFLLRKPKQEVKIWWEESHFHRVEFCLWQTLPWIHRTQQQRCVSGGSFCELASGYNNPRWAEFAHRLQERNADTCRTRIDVSSGKSWCMCEHKMLCFTGWIRPEMRRKETMKERTSSFSGTLSLANKDSLDLCQDECLHLPIPGGPKLRLGCRGPGVQVRGMALGLQKLSPPPG